MNDLQTRSNRRRAVTKRIALVLLIPILLCAGLMAAKRERIKLAAEAYLYGYPLVIIDVTRANSLQAIGAENVLYPLRKFPDAKFKYVVRPNVDTLYTFAFIDMAKGPWVFEMAANRQRYAVMQFMDGWSNVFASLGTRTTGTDGGRYLLAGPAWQGAVPAGFSLLRSPTRIVWLLGRTQTNGAADYPLVHRLQDGVKLRSLADWQAGRPAPTLNIQASHQNLAPAVAQVREMSTEAFFNRFAALLADNPPAAADGPMAGKLARLGVRPGRPVEWGVLDRWSATLGRWLADRGVARLLKSQRNLRRGWLTPPAILGNYGTEYGIRAGVAMVGLGANLPADAVYPVAQLDANGEKLNGQHRYRLHFNKGELPPVNAFWSVTAYGADDFFIDNPIDRYALGDRDALAFNQDGSLDLLIQAAPPDKDKMRNWLPVKAGEPFVLMARLYWPKAEILNGEWGMPSVERVD